MLLAVPAFASAAAFAQNPYSQPWALVESGDGSQVREEARVSISKVDGKSTRNPRKSDALPAGKHVITVHYDTARGVVNDEYRELQMDLEGCTRYRIVAKVNGPPVTEWKPHVYSEPIGECVAKFRKKDEPKK
ncbi:hypothetical protein BWI17_09610 [Betaproteobacteria bacterium GR16-43]|nr:hypothetical protein BWI17_09610 [Betaproteobacteria bacterium GR16-43]